MSLNRYRHKAAEFLSAVGARETPGKIIEWIDEEIALLKKAETEPQLAHQVYDVLFLLLELAALHNIDLDAQWSDGWKRKKAKYAPQRSEDT